MTHLAKLFVIVAVAITGAHAAEAQVNAPSRMPRAGENVAIQYRFSHADEFTLTNPSTGDHVLDSTRRELARLEMEKTDLLAKSARLQSAASRAGSSNPLLNRRGVRADYRLSMLQSGLSQNTRAAANVQRISELARQRSRLVGSDLRFLREHVFTEELVTRNSRELAQVTHRIRSINNSTAVLLAADPVPAATLTGRGLRLIRSPKGVVMIGVVASLALGGYQYYAEYRAEHAADNYSTEAIFERFE